MLKTNASKTAQAIRNELKALYPHIKFRVSSHTYSGGNSVRVGWVNGPTSDEICKNVTGKYQYGHFNGMEDIYENDNINNDIPQVKYLFCDRDFEQNIFDQAFEYLHKNCATFENANCIDHYLSSYGGSAREFIFRMLVKRDLTHGFEVAMLYDDYSLTH